VSNDYVEAGDKDAFTITRSGFTVAGWIRADTLPVGSTRMFAIGKGAAGSYEWAVSLNDATSGGDDTGKLNMTYWPSDGSLGMSRRSATTIAAGTWYYFVYTVGGTTATPNVYINEVLDNGTTVGTAPTITNRTAAVYVGWLTDQAANSSNGLIDDVRIYNRALSADEIKRLYNLGTPGR
jgi:hypothetical protein